mmetsp:Transcript_5359/g.15170  ORF Transcript_5359/g.15170 Transcript_5359/m.15170 type:complete len:216 (-) Transcript_5359:396-1043(-)
MVRVAWDSATSLACAPCSVSSSLDCLSEDALSMFSRTSTRSVMQRLMSPCSLPTSSRSPARLAGNCSSSSLMRPLRSVRSSGNLSTPPSCPSKRSRRRSRARRVPSAMPAVSRAIVSRHCWNIAVVSPRFWLASIAQISTARRRSSIPDTCSLSLLPPLPNSCSIEPQLSSRRRTRCSAASTPVLCTRGRGQRAPSPCREGSREECPLPPRQARV